MARLATVLGRILMVAGLFRDRRGRGRRGGVIARKEGRAIAVTSALCFSFVTISCPSSTEATAIFANGRGIAHKGSGGTTLAWPNAAITPAPGGPIPIPFPNIGDGSDGTTTHQSKIPVTKTDDEGVKIAIPYDVFFPADEAGVATIFLADSITGLRFVNYSFVLTETSTGVLFFDLTDLSVHNFDIVVELSLATDGSEPETKLLIPFIEGVGVSAVPEPASLLLFASGLLGLSGYRAIAERRRKSARPHARQPQV
jgi:hypothetical protein